jgi:hypothetical protein
MKNTGSISMAIIGVLVVSTFRPIDAQESTLRGHENNGKPRAISKDAVFSTSPQPGQKKQLLPVFTRTDEKQVDRIPYSYWVPLGALPSDTYELRLFDIAKGRPTLARWVEIQKEK